LSFLETQAEKSRQVAADHHGPAGELQVVVATHSPNLSAWVAGKKLVVFRSTMEPNQASDPQPAPTPGQESDGPATTATPSAGPVSTEQSVSAEILISTAPPTPPSRRATRCIPLHALGLDEAQWRKVDRYLDVTKSALLFGGRVLLLEGIAEALLLPVI